jgi:purine-binding chemotaxis protein CheW
VRDSNNRDKNEFAKESVVEDYLADLLTEPDEPTSALPEAATNLNSEARFNKELTQKLLDNSEAKLTPMRTRNSNFEEEQTEEEQSSVQLAEELNASLLMSQLASLETESQIIQQDHKEIQVQVETETSSAKVSSRQNLEDLLDERFQALFFEVAGLTLAVPLIELGGIHQITKISPIIGKPEWFMGVMLKNDDKFNVVDSARWVMPEKYNDEMAENLNYRFLINLGKTPWGLTCEKLVNTVELNKSDVKWRNNSGKRPWLAGMVKEKMCALINVVELVDMLEAGLGSK